MPFRDLRILCLFLSADLFHVSMPRFYFPGLLIHFIAINMYFPVCFCGFPLKTTDFLSKQGCVRTFTFLHSPFVIALDFLQLISC